MSALMHYARLLIVLPALALMLTISAATAAVVQTVTIAAPGSPEGVGFNEDHGGLAWTSSSETKQLELHINGGGSNIINSQVVDVDGPLWVPPDDNASCTAEKVWTTAPFTPKEPYRARFIGGYCGTKGGSASWEAAVIMADLDADANNNSTLFQRPPAIGGDEADKEQVAKRGNDINKPGLLIGVNRCYEEGGRDYDTDPYQEPGIDKKKYPREDNEKDGIFNIKPDPDLLEGLLTLKLPVDVPAKAQITYDRTKIRVYAMMGSDWALVPSATLFRVGMATSLVAATTSDRNGTFLSWGPSNQLKLEAIKTSPQSGVDDVVVTLIPDKGKESHNRLAYTATEINSTKKKGDPESAIKMGRICYPSKKIADKLAAGKSIKDTLKEELPKYAWFAYVEDESNTNSDATIKITSYDKNDVQIDTLDVNGNGKIKQISSGGKKYASDEIWFVPKDNKVTPSLDDNQNTIMVEAGGSVLIEYTTPGTTAKARKLILMPPEEKFMVVAYAGLGGEPSAAWDVATVSLSGPLPGIYLVKNYNADYGPFDKINGIEKIANHTHWEPAINNAETEIREWMKEDVSQGGTKCRNIFITSISWGARNAHLTAKWFNDTYEFTPRMAVMVEGVGPGGGAYGSIGPAFVCKNYYASESHWPRGKAQGDADNFSFDLTKKFIPPAVPVDWRTPVDGVPYVIAGAGTLTQTWKLVEYNTPNGPFKSIKTYLVTSNDQLYINDRAAGTSAHISAEWAGGVRMYKNFKDECPKNTSDH